MEANSFPEISIRAEADDDAADIVGIRNQPLVRWGTLALPYTSVAHYKRWRENWPDTDTGLVACIDGRPVGMAGLHRPVGARSLHKASLGIMVHDDFHGRGVGSALMAALVGLADDWLNLRRLELHVYTDNHRAIALYKRFGFAVEGTLRADAFRAGIYVDCHVMARLKPGIPV